MGSMSIPWNRKFFGNQTGLEFLDKWKSGKRRKKPLQFQKKIQNNSNPQKLPTPKPPKLPKTLSDLVFLQAGPFLRGMLATSDFTIQSVNLPSPITCGKHPRPVLDRPVQVDSKREFPFPDTFVLDKHAPEPWTPQVSPNFWRFIVWLTQLKWK